MTDHQHDDGAIDEHHVPLADGGTVPPENYELWDEEREKYICPFCDGRLLRIGDYAECTECGERFQRRSEWWGWNSPMQQ